MTNIELQALRRLFMLKVAEAARYIGDTSTEQWHEWEKGTSTIPAEVILKMQNLRKERKEKVARIIEDINDRIGNSTIKYFMTFEEFQKINPSLDIVHWRLHQSIATELYFRGLEKLC
ncbi:Aca2/YdiL-like domain-containing protein [Zophobihabitans entericus]|uniref:YdiL family protein n=1 Tax=Zophobihabitans entericus TaxID=1635327 RepID=A0A6G9IAT4_9GAMM|nr:DUF1870 family protein [Zophobihabitans entericus]QIQ20834.1 YdiL family protein [Zophobihabitans entericus]